MARVLLVLFIASAIVGVLSAASYDGDEVVPETAWDSNKFNALLSSNLHAADRGAEHHLDRLLQATLTGGDTAFMEEGAAAKDGKVWQVWEPFGGTAATPQIHNVLHMSDHKKVAERPKKAPAKVKKTVKVAKKKAVKKKAAKKKVAKKKVAKKKVAKKKVAKKPVPVVKNATSTVKNASKVAKVSNPKYVDGPYGDEPPVPPTYFGVLPLPNEPEPVSTSCRQRKKDALDRLVDYNAAKTLLEMSEKYHVEDPKAKWRMTQWQQKYIKAASDFAFYCEQSEAAMHKIAETIQEKEEMRAKKSALRGLQDAVRQKKEAHFKKYHERDSKVASKKAKAQEANTKAEIHLVASKARLKRLHSYPQAVKDLVGYVGDAMTGEGLAGVTVKSKCPFNTYSTVTTSKAGRVGQYIIKKGASGPVGYRCFLVLSKPGYVTLPMKLLINKTPTKAIFRHAFLLPEAKATNNATMPYHVIMQYGDRPADLDAHLQIYGNGKPAWDIALHRGGTALDLRFSADGTSKNYPFVTLDSKVNTGYGPQTHTIHVAQPGTYTYYVENYDHHFVSNNVFHHCGAKVYVYHGNTLMSQYRIRSALGTPATFWQVFVMECATATDCTIKPARAFSKQRPVTPSMFSV